MKFSSNFVKLSNFSLSLSQFAKFVDNISDAFELWKFQTHNTKAMAKDKKVNIAFTYLPETNNCSLSVGSNSDKEKKVSKQLD